MPTRLYLIVAATFAVASSALAGTLYVATNGADGPACGTKTSPCRSISRAITNAVVGDKIVVGPGHYGASVETPAPGCGCMLALNKAVSLESSHGAAQTMIDGRGSPEARTILVITDGGSFGKPGKGFLVTQSGGGNHQAMVIDANDVKIRGNQFVPVLAGSIGVGVEMVDSPGTVAIEANQVVGWATGILMRGPNKTVRKNVVMENGAGIFTSAGSTVSGNVVIGNSEGIRLVAGETIVSGNAVMNNSFGITNMNVGPPGSGAAFTGTISKNNILGNGCGVTNDGVIGLAADDNYWGAATGPGPDPADDVCNSSGGTTTVTTFATTPFKVKPRIKP